MAQRELNDSRKDIPEAVEFYHKNEAFFDLLLDFHTRFLGHIDYLGIEGNGEILRYDFKIVEGELSISFSGVQDGGVVRQNGRHDLLSVDEWQLLADTLKKRIVPRSSYSEGTVVVITPTTIYVMYTTSLGFGSPVMSAEEWGDPHRHSFTEAFNDNWSLYIWTSVLR